MAMNKSLGEMLRFVSMDESQALQDICEYNDISDEQLMASENIRILEMFLFNFTRICCMTFFPNLTSLSLVQQNLRTIEGLHCLPHLEILRLSENEIQRIEGLSNCLKLKEVFLHNNRITRITNLSHLTGLRVLWLANNLIKHVEGLDNLQIKELNIAKNPLCKLGNILKIKTLKYLNVSGTNIGSFKEISNLTRLTKLKDLRFLDPHWGPSPLALLHNYQTYILFRLQYLQKLDTLDLSEEAKQTAKVTYARKRVYYNLCIKSLQQSKSNIHYVAMESMRIKGLQKNLAQYIKASKDAEKNLVGTVALDKSREESREPLPTPSKTEAANVSNPICTLLKRIDSLNKDLQLSKAREQAAIDLNIHWLMVELDSGGNIRMESGNPKDVWYKSCVELVMSRFFVDDYAPLGITGVHVNRVTRIHNRYLQDRFEKQHECQMLKNGNKSVEYLLYGETLQVHDELQCIVEGGFPLSANRAINSPSSSPVVLSNSVGLADSCRLKIFAENPNLEIPSGRTAGWVLVVKTCLGISVKDVRCKYTQISCKKESFGSFKAVPIKIGENVYEVQRRADGDGVAAKKASYPHADSVYRSHPTDSKQRSWFVFDAGVVVPEYLVEFEYFFTNKTSDMSTPPCETSGCSFGGVDLIEKDPGVFSPLSDLEPSLIVNKDASHTQHMDPLLNDSSIMLMKAPQACQLSQEFPTANVSLSLDFILRSDGIPNLQFIGYLNFHDSNISDIEALRGMRCLRVLILSFNKISTIKGLEDLAILERLDLSYNLVTRIEGLNGLEHLTNLDLGGNQISNPNDLALLQCQVPKLSSLNLRANPIVGDLDYPMMVLRTLSILVELDSNPISSQERIAANRNYVSSPALLFSSPISEWGTLPPSVLSLPSHDKDLQDGNHRESDQENCWGDVQVDANDKRVGEEASSTNEYVLTQLADPFRLSPYSMSPCRFCPINMFVGPDMVERGRRHVQDGRLRVTDDAWYDDVEEVHLECHKLKTMHCFDRLSNLRRLFLCENHISVIEGLDNCSMLEELLLNDNHITQVDNVKHVQALWRLDLSHNCLTCCGQIGYFQALEQLSLDCNKLQSLKGLDALMSLMELYVTNNLIADFGEINYIRNLPKLIVVDLSGNALCEINDYRMYTIYTLKKLKVLDGRNVETNELTLARNKYSGRLTRDMLEECMGQCQFFNLEVLDLSGQKLRSCGEVFESMELRALTELNLNDNLLSSIHALRHLENLKILQLENNRFEDMPLFEARLDSPSEAHCPQTSYSTMDIEGGQGRSSIHSTRVSDEDDMCLPSLEVLKLGGNMITSISSLCLYCRFPNLRLLALHDNKITKVDGLTGLNSLEKLYLDHNEVKELEPHSFIQLRSLRVLCLSNNALKTLVNLSELVALESLDLAGNQIAPNRMGGLASIEVLVGLQRLLKLSFINNPISRQNLYRISVISRLLQLLYLDEREITEEERQEAELYTAGNKEPAPLLINPSALIDYNTNGPGPSVSSGVQLKIPLKVTSLNFESMCLQQSPRGTYQISNPTRSRVTVYNHVPNLTGVKYWDIDDPKHQSGVLRRCLDRNQPLMRGRGKGENKVIMIPYSTYVKNISPSKEWTQKFNVQNRGYAL